MSTKFYFSWIFSERTNTYCGWKFFLHLLSLKSLPHMSTRLAVNPQSVDWFQAALADVAIKEGLLCGYRVPHPKPKHVNLICSVFPCIKFQSDQKATDPDHLKELTRQEVRSTITINTFKKERAHMSGSPSCCLSNKSTGSALKWGSSDLHRIWTIPRISTNRSKSAILICLAMKQQPCRFRQA